MGGNSSKLEANYVQELALLTYLTKNEVKHCYSRFRELDPEMDKNNGYMSIRIPSKEIIEKFPELYVNPFADRICHVFSSEKDEKMSFEDFVDMLSALGVNTPPKVKAEWAFQIFDFDDDGMIKANDIRELVNRITGITGRHKLKESDADRNQLSESEMEKVIKHVLKEAAIHRTGYIEQQEFRNLMGKSANFASNFCLKV